MWYNKNMKKTISIIKKEDDRKGFFVAGSASERLQYVWPLTEEIVSLGGKYDAQRRLQRNVTSIAYRKR
jgi:hypothetical protein